MATNSTSNTDPLPKWRFYDKKARIAKAINPAFFNSRKTKLAKLWFQSCFREMPTKGYSKQIIPFILANVLFQSWNSLWGSCAKMSHLEICYTCPVYCQNQYKNDGMLLTKQQKRTAMPFYKRHRGTYGLMFVQTNWMG